SGLSCRRLGCGQNHLTIYAGRTGTARGRDGRFRRAAALHRELASTGGDSEHPNGLRVPELLSAAGTDRVGKCDAARNDWRQRSRKRGGRKFARSWFRRTAATFAGGTFRRRATTRGDRACAGE